MASKQNVLDMKKEEFDNLLRLLKLIGGKFIIVEDGQPKAVLLSYEEFQELVVPRLTEKLLEKAEKIEKINQEITQAQLADLLDEVTIEPLG